MHWLRSCRLRVGQYHDLSGIRGIREDFLISGDGGVEDDFARPLHGRTKTLALEDRAVFQGEDCWIQLDRFLQTGVTSISPQSRRIMAYNKVAAEFGAARRGHNVP